MGKFSRWLGEELSLYVRQLAWLSAVPRRDGEDPKSNEEPVSRQKELEADGLPIDLPPVSDLTLVEQLFDIGAVEGNGLGTGPMKWREMDAWAARNGIDLPPWQAATIMRLSRDYASQAETSKRLDCPAPWAAELTEDGRDAVTRKVSFIFGGLRQA